MGVTHEHVCNVGGHEGVVEDVEVLLGDLLGCYGRGHIGDNIDPDKLQHRDVVAIALSVIEEGLFDGEVNGWIRITRQLRWI